MNHADHTTGPHPDCTQCVDDWIECAYCDKVILYEMSWSPGDDAICDVCDTEVTGRVHPSPLEQLAEVAVTKPKNTLDARLAMLRKGTLKRIHVDKHIMAQNRKRDPADAKPPITIQTSKGPLKALEVEVLGPSRFTYSPCKPLSCGARLWIETRAELRIVSGV